MSCHVILHFISKGGYILCPMPANISLQCIFEAIRRRCLHCSAWFDVNCSQHPTQSHCDWLTLQCWVVTSHVSVCLCSIWNQKNILALKYRYPMHGQYEWLEMVACTLPSAGAPLWSVSRKMRAIMLRRRTAILLLWARNRNEIHLHFMGFTFLNLLVMQMDSAYLAVSPKLKERSDFKCALRRDHLKHL